MVLSGGGARGFAHIGTLRATERRDVFDISLRAGMIKAVRASSCFPPMAAVTLLTTDIMLRLLTDAQYAHHPVDRRIAHELPTVRVEAFWELEAVVAAGEAEAERALDVNAAWLQRLTQRRDAPHGTVD